jgi:hypothetical protein
MSFNVKSEILAAIGKTNDESMKTILLLLLGVLEEIGGKVDSVLTNERALRQTVLNGYTDDHHGHHEWLERRIKRDDKVDVIIGWAENKILKEREAEEDARKIKVGTFEKVLGSIIFAALSFAAGWFFQK